MVSVNQDHAFPSKHPLQLGIRLGYLSVVSGVLWVGGVCCAARLEGYDSSIIDPFSSNNRREVFLGL